VAVARLLDLLLLLVALQTEHDARLVVLGAEQLRRRTFAAMRIMAGSAADLL
jgi:hypothetical protein